MSSTATYILGGIAILALLASSKSGPAALPGKPTSAGSDNHARIPELEVWGDPSVAALSASPTDGNQPLAVQFTDISSGAPSTISARR